MRKERITTFLQGMAMGVAELMPGVGGSTVALAMGIYDDFVGFLHQISQLMNTVALVFIGRREWNDAKAKFREVNFKFGLLLGLGACLAFGLFSGLVLKLLTDYPHHVYALFFGLVLAAAFAPWEEMKKEKTVKDLLVILMTLTLGFVFLSLSPPSANGNPGMLIMFLGGMVSISGMAIPGISVSFILLLLGLYDYLLTLVRNLVRFDISGAGAVELLVFLVGTVIGFTLFIRVLKIALSRYRQGMMAVSVGLILASLRVLWPFWVGGGDAPRVLVWPWEVEVGLVLPSLVLVLVGFVSVIALRKANGIIAHGKKR